LQCFCAVYTSIKLFLQVEAAAEIPEKEPEDEDEEGRLACL